MVLIPQARVLITLDDTGRFMFLNHKGVLSDITELPYCSVLTV